MRQHEREYLNAIIEQLVDIQAQSPQTTVYVQGSAQPAAFNRIQGVIDALIDLLGEDSAANGANDERTETE